jgi:hypothetical protein
MNYEAKTLLQMSRSQLDDLFRKSAVGAIPGGGLKGTFIVAPGTPLTEIAAELIRLMVWQGKVFDAQHGRANNRVLPFSFESVPAKVYKAASRFDGKECIVLDYSETSFVARWVRDEIREVAPGLYLGKVYFAGIPMPDFILEREMTK